MSDVTRIPPAKCLQCDSRLNALGALEGEPQPEPGSLIVCIRCGAVMMASDDLTPRGMTDAEMDEVLADRATMDDLARLVARVHFVQAMGN
jgi:hypothetical protein